MNLSNTHDRDQAFLEPFIAAVRDAVPREDVDSAAARFRQTLPRPAPRFGRWRLGLGALAGLMAVALLPALLPTSGGSAFAEVQAWFTEFRNARIETQMRFGDSVVTEQRIWLNDAGSVRIDSGPVTHILDPTDGSMSTLLPDGSVMRVPLEGLGEESDPRAALAWLNQIRDFQGQAEPLPDPQLIDGYLATGFRLQLQDTDLILWAAQSDNRPLRLEGVLPGGLKMVTTMAFDLPLPQGIFEVPAESNPDRSGH